MSALGMQSMVVQASDMSTPVLTALGFRATATLSVLADRASRGD
jgi:hypothetical protein